MRLKLKEGHCGIGLYWCIVELLYETDGYFPLDYDLLAMELGADVGLLKSVVCDFDLFTIENNQITSESILSRLVKISGKREKARFAANQKWLKKKEIDASALRSDMRSDMRSDSEKNATVMQERRGEERKGKKRKEKEIVSTNVDTQIVARDEFLEVYISWYKNKCGLEPKINFAYEIKALGEIKKYLESQIKDGHSVLEAWKVVLEKNDLWGRFESTQIKISQINKNFANIILNIKNGKQKPTNSRNTLYDKLSKDM